MYKKNNGLFPHSPIMTSFNDSLDDEQKQIDVNENPQIAIANEKNQAKTLNRRYFLGLTSIGIASMGVLGTGTHRAFASTLMPETLDCLSPTITTRLFASSNTGADALRNKRSLQRLACAGFKVQNPEITGRQYLRFAGTDSQRMSDLQNIATGAIEAPKLLLGVRGGYGAIRLLEHIDWQTLGRIMQDRGSILAGFSDVTAIQCALLAQGGMSSLSAPMLYSEFGKTEPDKISCQGFVDALTAPNLTLELLPQKNIEFSSKPISGMLWGGNLSVVSALAGSKYLPQPEGGIVFLEDVGEQTYHIERMLYGLFLAGTFKNQQAIVLGAFSNIGKDTYDARYDMSIVIEQLRRMTGLPVYTGLPFGHVARKQSFPIGAMCTLNHDDKGLALEFSGYPVIEKSLIHTEGLWR